MKKFLSLVALMFAFAITSQAQCVLPAVQYNQNQTTITVKEKDRGTIYNVTWTNPSGVEIGNMTNQVSMWHSGGGRWVIGAAPNTADPDIYLLGSVQPGSTVTISKYCSGSFVQLSTVVIQ